MQGKDMFVTDRKDSSSSRHSRETALRYIQTLVKHVPGAIAWFMLRKHWGRAVTMPIWDPHFWGEAENGLVKE